MPQSLEDGKMSFCKTSSRGCVKMWRFEFAILVGFSDLSLWRWDTGSEAFGQIAKVLANYESSLNSREHMNELVEKKST
jgi:hypothetical protein